jgi:hypothetical protein
MNVRYRVDLSQIERTALRALLSGGKHASRKLKRAQILLAADAGASDEELQGASAWAAPDQATLRSLLQSFLSLEEAGNPESAKDSVRYPCGASQFDDSMANTSPAWRTYDLYAEAPDPKQPVVCFDESPVQLIGEIRQPISARPGQARTLRLRVSSQWDGQSLRTPRRSSSLAQGQSHRAASGRRLRPMHARSRRHPLSRCRDHPGRPG